MKSKMRILNLALGPTLFLLGFYCLPASVFPGPAARASVGLVSWMAYWWVTAPVDYAVTALLPIAVNAFCEIIPMPKVLANYSSEIIMLLLGASIIAVSWEETGVDKRIASKLLVWVGNGLRRQIVFWFVLPFVLSSVLPNAVVCATVTPIAVAMLKYVGEGDIGNSRIASKILLAIAYAAGAGGLATPLGGAMNLITVDYIQQLTGAEFMYIDWVLRLLPVVLVIVITNAFFMIRDVRKDETLGGSREYFRQEYAKMPKSGRDEVVSLVLFFLAAAFAFARPLYKNLLPGLKPAYAFVACAILSFMFAKKGGGRLMVWKTVQRKIVWEMIFIFAGGLALGAMINGSGAAKAIGGVVSTLSFSSTLLAVFVFITVPLILSDFTSNTATAAVTIPIVIAVAQGIGKDPLPFVYVASIGVNLSYMLPTSIRAIPIGYGLSPRYMLSEGWKITLLMIVALTLVSWVQLVYFPIGK